MYIFLSVFQNKYLNIFKSWCIDLRCKCKIVLKFLFKTRRKNLSMENENAISFFIFHLVFIFYFVILIVFVYFNNTAVRNACWHCFSTHDTLCNLLQEIKAVGNELGITPTIIRGEELKQKGFGGNLTFLEEVSRLQHSLNYGEKDELAFSSQDEWMYVLF